VVVVVHICHALIPWNKLYKARFNS
jgi:hypothetical protein